MVPLPVTGGGAFFEVKGKRKAGAFQGKGKRKADAFQGK